MCRKSRDGDVGVTGFVVMIFRQLTLMTLGRKWLVNEIRYNSLSDLVDERLLWPPRDRKAALEHH